MSLAILMLANGVLWVALGVARARRVLGRRKAAAFDRELERFWNEERSR